MLVHYRDLFKKKDFAGKYAIPAFNTHNLEITLGIVRAAVKKRSPVILEASRHTIDYAGLKNLHNVVASVANDPSVDIPVALHLDHTKNLRMIERAINAGFSSVMIDGSSLDFEKNVEVTKKAVEFAHKKKVWVQAELGRLRGTEDWVSVSDAESSFTDPDEAEEFVQRTNINTLAIAVGTMHGIVKYREKIDPKLDIDRIKKIREKVDIPLVLHGASKVSEEQIRKAVKAGIQVINIDTELRIAFTTALRNKLKEDETEIDPRKILAPVIDAVQKTAELKLDQFKTVGKA